MDDLCFCVCVHVCVCVQGALTALLRAVQHVEDECQQIIMTSTTEDLQNTLANGNALLSMQPQQQAQQGQQQA